MPVSGRSPRCGAPVDDSVPLGDTVIRLEKDVASMRQTVETYLGPFAERLEELEGRVRRLEEAVDALR